MATLATEASEPAAVQPVPGPGEDDWWEAVLSEHPELAHHEQPEPQEPTSPRQPGRQQQAREACRQMQHHCQLVRWWHSLGLVYRKRGLR